MVDVHDPLGATATLHLARPGDSSTNAGENPPGAMCGASLGFLIGIGPLDELREAHIVRPEWELCPTCFPRG